MEMGTWNSFTGDQLNMSLLEFQFQINKESANVVDTLFKSSKVFASMKIAPARNPMGRELYRLFYHAKER